MAAPKETALPSYGHDLGLIEKGLLYSLANIETNTLLLACVSWWASSGAVVGVVVVVAVVVAAVVVAAVVVAGVVVAVVVVAAVVVAAVVVAEVVVAEVAVGVEVISSREVVVLVVVMAAVVTAVVVKVVLVVEVVAVVVVVPMSAGEMVVVGRHSGGCHVHSSSFTNEFIHIPSMYSQHESWMARSQPDIVPGQWNILNKRDENK